MKVRLIWTAILVAGCGTALPPQELVDARAAFEKIKTGQAAQIRPDEVHEAKLALDQAEAVFTDDPKSEKAKDVAYLALRRAQLAQSSAEYATAAAQRDQSGKELMQLQSQGISEMQADLSKTKQALEIETKARQDAEKRARDAMDRLAVAAALAVKDEPRGTVITLPGNVLFGSGKWSLLPEAQKKLDSVADALKNQEDHKMVVEGHTDSQGNDNSNMELGARRAQAVRDYLVSRGVPSGQISSVGIGQARPIANNNTSEGRAQNRRVEIIVQPLEKR